MKKKYAAVLTVIILTLLASVSVFAEADNELTNGGVVNDSVAGGFRSFSFVNPEYEELAGIIEAAEALENENNSENRLYAGSENTAQSSEDEFDTEKYEWEESEDLDFGDYANETELKTQIAEIVRAHMVLREENFHLKIDNVPLESKYFHIIEYNEDEQEVTEEGEPVNEDEGKTVDIYWIVEENIYKLVDENILFGYNEDMPSDEGDYLKFHTYKYPYYVVSMDMGYVVEYYEYYNVTYASIEFYFIPTYLTDAAQEEIVTAKVAELLESFGFTDTTSDYVKIKTIYDYLCQNVTYDYTYESMMETYNPNALYASLDDDEKKAYLLTHTAYAALINHTSVCQGYSNAFYRLAEECGLDARIVTGGGHAWNAVRIGDYWYYLDSTWDAEYAQAGQPYVYFLRIKKNMAGHTLESSFAKTLKAAPNDFILGDINFSGSVTDDAADAVYLAKYIAGWNVTFDFGGKTYGVDTERLDLDGDGKITPRDSMILTRYLAGWEGYETLPVA